MHKIYDMKKSWFLQVKTNCLKEITVLESTYKQEAYSVLKTLIEHDTLMDCDVSLDFSLTGFWPLKKKQPGFKFVSSRIYEKGN